MDAWKAKAKAASASATASVQSAYDKKKNGASSTSTPSQSESKYAPNRYDPTAAPPLSLAERTAQSGVLRGQKEREWVPPPRPPVRHTSSTGSAEGSSVGARPPVPPSRGAKPAFLAPESSKSATSQGLKPFSAYNHQDKQEFFGMLDEFFAGKAMPAWPPGSTTSQTTSTGYRRTGIDTATPAIPSSSRPGTTKPSPSFNPPSNAPSYPPPQPHASSALTILHYIMYEQYETEWYKDMPSLPSPLVGRNDVRMSASQSQLGGEKTALGVAVFGDASMVWWKISWNVDGRGEVRRDGRYRPIPTPWDGEQLYAASEMYGPTLVEFAEEAVEGRRAIGRGECWDLANDGIDYARSRVGEKPFPSIGRTHGMIMFYARAGGKGLGKWSGADEYVRPGDIVEWRNVKIREVGMPNGAYAILGDPDVGLSLRSLPFAAVHAGIAECAGTRQVNEFGPRLMQFVFQHTAIIVEAASPSSLPSPDTPYPISSLVSLTVVEQSLGQAPRRAEYALDAMSEGEIWIYRPAGLLEMLGCEIEPVWPSSQVAYSIDQI